MSLNVCVLQWVDVLLVVFGPGSNFRQLKCDVFWSLAESEV